jgi:hypothetical protein
MEFFLAMAPFCICSYNQIKDKTNVAAGSSESPLFFYFMLWQSRRQVNTEKTVATRQVKKYSKTPLSVVRNSCLG